MCKVHFLVFWRSAKFGPKKELELDVSTLMLMLMMILMLQLLMTPEKCKNLVPWKVREEGLVLGERRAQQFHGLEEIEFNWIGFNRAI